MPNVATGHRYKVAIAKQTAEGTPATSPDYIIPAYSGGLAPVQNRQRHEVADGNAYRPGGFIQRAHVEGSVELACFPNSIGRILMGHLASDTLSGIADPWTHTMVRADNQPWHTVWIARPKPDATLHWDRFEDCLIPSIEFGWAAGVPLRCSVRIVGKAAVGNLAAAPAGGVENKLDNSEVFYTAIGSVLNLDLDATPAVTRVRNIESFTMRFAYEGLELVQTDELTPRFRDSGLWTVGFSADALLENYESYLATFFGSKSAAAAALSGTIVSGSLDFLFNTAPTVNANRTLQVKLPALEYAVTAPDIDASGRGVRVGLTAEVQRPAAGDPLTTILKNAVSTAY